MAPWLEPVLRLVVAVALGTAVGYERELRGKSAGMRTHALIALGSAAFAAASLYGFPQADLSRVAAGVVTGVGFIGGGVIFRGHRDGGGEISGLTTAASIWVTAGIGVAAGCGLYLLATVVAVLAIIVLELPRGRD
ncbi:MAG: MgtC/SapB family protein [Dehalococcoidia bacterium]|nr:MgtC/SapB family protein [Dehalococcoidia bacterium]